MFRVVVSGANSFIGLELIKQLSNKNYYIYALVRKDASNVNVLKHYKNVEVIYYTLDTIMELEKVIGVSCDIFIHLAWAGIRGVKRNDEIIQRKNFEWACDAFELARLLSCEIFVTAGSQAEYGNVQGKIIKESTLGNPVTQYGKYKEKFYRFLRDQASVCGIRIIEPRFFSLYGPYDYSGSLITTLIKKMKKDEVCNLTKAENWWNYLYVSDAANAVIKLIEKQECEGIFNVASDDSRLLREYVEEIREILGSNSNIVYGALPYPQGGKIDLLVDISKITTVTDWRALVEFDDGIQYTNDFLEEKRS